MSSDNVKVFGQLLTIAYAMSQVSMAVSYAVVNKTGVHLLWIHYLNLFLLGVVILAAIFLRKQRRAPLHPLFILLSLGVLFFMGRLVAPVYDHVTGSFHNTPIFWIAQIGILMLSTFLVWVMLRFPSVYAIPV